MNVSKYLHLAVDWTKKNSPTILAVGACGGVVATAVLSAKATPKAIAAVQEAEQTKGEPLTKLEMVKACAKPYLPTAAAAALTCGAILTGDIISRKQKSCLVAATAAATSAYQRLESAMNKHTTEEQRMDIQKEMAQQAMDDAKKGAIDIPMAAEEDLFYEPHYGYFAATKAEVYKAINDCNEFLAENGYCTLEYFFNCLCIDDNVTKGLGYIGWHLSEIDDMSGYALIHMRLSDGVPLEPICENGLTSYQILWDTSVIENPEEYDSRFNYLATTESPEE